MSRLGRVVGEIGNDVAMTVQNVQNFKAIVNVPKENYVAAKCKTSNIVVQIRPRAPDLEWQAGKLVTLLT